MARPRHSRRSWPQAESTGHAGRVFVAVLLLFLRAVSAAAGAAETPVVGVVEAISGPSRDYALRRGDAILPLRMCDQVQAGDRIVVRRDDGLVRVRLTTGDLQTISWSQSDRPIEARGAPASVHSNLLSGLARLLTPWHDFVASNLSVRGATQPAAAVGPFELPLVLERGAAVAAGQHVFTLAWLGGRPPFRVTLAEAGGEGGRAILEADGVQGRELPAREVALPAGAYTLRLADAAGERIERPLTAVLEDQVPRAPPDPALTALPEAWRVTAQAGWLARRDGGRWLLGAFLETAPLAAGFEPARILADLLAVGGPVGPP